MARHNEPISSREALLRSKDAIPLRTSLEEAYKSSSEDDRLSDYDIHEWKDDTTNQHDRTRRYKKEYQNSDSPVYAYEKSTKGLVGSRLMRFGRCCSPTRKSLFITFILLGILLAVLTGSGFWVYKHAPEDGVSLSRSY